MDTTNYKSCLCARVARSFFYSTIAVGTVVGAAIFFAYVNGSLMREARSLGTERQFTWAGLALMIMALCYVLRFYRHLQTDLCDLCLLRKERDLRILMSAFTIALFFTATLQMGTRNGRQTRPIKTSYQTEWNRPPLPVEPLTSVTN
jgi:hypothetical protein